MASTSGPDNDPQLQDRDGANLQAKGQGASTSSNPQMSASECQSLCCLDNAKPYQPTSKSILACMSNNGRHFMEKWFKSYPWLTICVTCKKAFCFHCRSAESKGLLTFSSKAEPTFTRTGFNNWKKALEKFHSHSQCDAHQEAILKCHMVQTTPVSNQLVSAAKKEQSERRDALVKQLHCLRYLLRQGLAIRGHKESEGNLHQLMSMFSYYDSNLKKWMKENRYLSPVIVNELISIMGQSVLRILLDNIKEYSPAWFSIIGDEATDVANREQFNLSIRWVNAEYEISEDPVGLYALPNTKADTLYTVLTDILTRCSLPLSMCRGQAYDGASNMQGRRNGLATRIKNEIPAALPVHCLGHCLNLCLQDAGRKMPCLRDALDLVREIVKLIKYSPKRSHLFSEKLTESQDFGVVTLKPLCPTRWTARTAAIGAVLSDYGVLMETLEEVYQTTRDEYGLKANGLLLALEKFSTIFGLKLGYLIFSASETLSVSLQGKDTTLQEALSAVNLAKAFYRRQRTEQAFSIFYDDVVSVAQKECIGEPQLPRYRRAPARLDDGTQPHRFSDPKAYYRHQYFEVCDMLLQELNDRFDQDNLLPPIQCLENLLLKAANGDRYDENFQGLKTSCYITDIDFDQLQIQLPLLASLIRQALPHVSKVTSIRTICEAMNTQAVYKSMLSEVHNILRLYMTVPITSATSERSFSALKVVNTCLRSSMSEKRLNNCFILHVHKEITDSCDMVAIAQEFIAVNTERRKFFGVFS